MTLVEYLKDVNWQQTLKELSESTGLAFSLTDPNGSILESVGGRNALCERIRSNKETLTYICSQTNTAMTAQVKALREPVLEACEAGLIRIAIPVYHADELIGQVTACGVLSDPEEVDPEYLSHQLDLPESEILSMLKTAKRGDEDAILKLTTEAIHKMLPDAAAA